MLTNGFSPLALSQTTDTAQANAAYTVEDGTQNESSPQAPPENVTGSEPKVDPESGVPEDDLPGSEPQEPVSNAIDGQASWLSV